MALDIVYGVIKNRIAIENLIKAINKIDAVIDDDSTLFLGYPLTVKSDESVTVDALLFTKKKGIVAFIIHDKDANEKDRQDKLYFDFDFALAKYDKLRQGRGLAISKTVITYFGMEPIIESDNEEYIFVNDDNISIAYEKIKDLNSGYYDILSEAIYKVSKIKPKKKRANVAKKDSKGAIIKRIEKEVANLDIWQKKAAYEVPEGPQQIRGLAGSGKTVVLAMKAAYLHSQHPEWNIAVTFYTRSLKQQYEKLISDFMQEFSDNEPDWEKLQIMHSWGSNTETGVYSVAAKQLNLIPYDYITAKRKFGFGYEFSGACNELLYAGKGVLSPVFDAILIDEAQDLPDTFFKICYGLTNTPKRVVFAYDELQNLNNLNTISVEKIFGSNEDSIPIVSLKNEENQPRQDIVLPICYRNTKWALTIAHALGFGIYRKNGMIQGFDDPLMWNDIGYEVKSGDLKRGKKVRLLRGSKSTPSYFDEFISPQDAFISKVFKDEHDQFLWIAEEIKKNIEEDELDPDDILVIFPDAYYSHQSYQNFKRYLSMYNIQSILAGITTDRDTFKVMGAITCSSIYRAKGNEFPMVYVADAQFGNNGSDMVTKRNIIFTAITRARAWVRICGYGEGMEMLNQEIQKCVDNSYILDFKNPTDEELKKMKSLYKSISKENKELISKSSLQIKQLADLVKKGEISRNDIAEIIGLFSEFTDE